MISSKREYREYVNSDREANRIGRSLHRKLLITWRYLKCLRRLEYFINCRKDPIGKICVAALKFRMYHLSVKSGISIPPNVFGKGLYMPHHGLIIVNSDVKCGDHCVLQAGTNISDGVRCGNHVYIGAGAKIMRNVCLGDDVIIGANAVVTKSIQEDNVVLGGVPASVISHNGFRDRKQV